MSKLGTKAALKGKTVTGRQVQDSSERQAHAPRSACQVCCVDDDSAPSVRVECRGGHEFTVHSKCWEGHKRMYFKTLHRSHRDYAIRQRYPRCCVVGACSSDIMRETDLEPLSSGTSRRQLRRRVPRQTTLLALQRSVHEAFHTCSEHVSADPRDDRRRLRSGGAGSATTECLGYVGNARLL